MAPGCLSKNPTNLLRRLRLFDQRDERALHEAVLLSEAKDTRTLFSRQSLNLAPFHKKGEAAPGGLSS